MGRSKRKGGKSSCKETAVETVSTPTSSPSKLNASFASDASTPDMKEKLKQKQTSSSLRSLNEARHQESLLDARRIAVGEQSYARRLGADEMPQEYLIDIKDERLRALGIDPDQAPVPALDKTHAISIPRGMTARTFAKEWLLQMLIQPCVEGHPRRTLETGKIALKLSMSLLDVAGMALAMINIATGHNMLRDLARGLRAAECVGAMCGAGEFDMAILSQEAEEDIEPRSMGPQLGNRRLGLDERCVLVVRILDR